MPRHPNSLANLRPPFKSGDVNNPAGRPQGARSKLNEFALRALLEDFTQHGVAVIAKVREKRPEAYLAAVVGLLPRQAQKLDSPFTDLSDDELEQLEQLLAAMRAKTVRDLNRVAPKPNHVISRNGHPGPWRATEGVIAEPQQNSQEGSEQTRPSEAREQQVEEGSALASALGQDSLGDRG